MLRGDFEAHGTAGQFGQFECSLRIGHGLMFGAGKLDDGSFNRVAVNGNHCALGDGIAGHADADFGFLLRLELHFLGLSGITFAGDGDFIHPLEGVFQAKLALGIAPGGERVPHDPHLGVGHGLVGERVVDFSDKHRIAAQ
jgi:hypothetical protein